MLNAILFFGFPIILCWQFGFYRPAIVGVLLMFGALLWGFSFITGIGLSYMFGDGATLDAWRAYNLPPLWLNEWMSTKMGPNDPMSNILAVPWIAIVDFFRVVIDVNLKMGSFALLFPQVVALMIMVNISRYLMSMYGTPLEENSAKKQASTTDDAEFYERFWKEYNKK